jgi:hypothetical protein
MLRNIAVGMSGASRRGIELRSEVAVTRRRSVMMTSKLIASSRRPSALTWRPRAISMSRASGG